MRPSDAEFAGILRPIYRPARIKLDLGLLEGVLGLGQGCANHHVASWPWKQTTAHHQPRETRSGNECWGVLLTQTNSWQLPLLVGLLWVKQRGGIINCLNLTLL